MNKTSSKYTVWSVLFVVTAIAIFIVGKFYYGTKPNPNVGWQPVTKVTVFKPGITTNGKVPANIHVALDAPNKDQLDRLKPGQNCEFQVSVDSQDEELAPTFVILKVLKGTRTLTRVIMTPHSKQKGNYIYKNSINVPKDAGKYEFTITAQYAVYDNTSGKNIHLPDATCIIKGMTINVQNQ
jgi:lipoprotein-anchoring transpeptidase ErfK/SrfK